MKKIRLPSPVIRQSTPENAGQSPHRQPVCISLPESWTNCVHTTLGLQRLPITWVTRHFNQFGLTEWKIISSILKIIRSVKMLRGRSISPGNKVIGLSRLEQLPSAPWKALSDQTEWSNLDEARQICSSIRVINSAQSTHCSQIFICRNLHF